ncbi:DUF4440 domain-containing protein [Acidobacteria bacterium AB60]|nr:DUF4440 domain-containing protein [Acidobacteria bacterium AB60]
MTRRILTPAAIALLAATAAARPPADAARRGIDAGNQAWIDGIKAGDIRPILATYAEDAVDCSAAGECTQGIQAIERAMTAQLAALGRARSARVTTWGYSEHGNFAYEWGQAEASLENGKTLVEPYLTVWQRQPNGTWKIFRNLVIPRNNPAQK